MDTPSDPLLVSLARSALQSVIGFTNVIESPYSSKLKQSSRSLEFLFALITSNPLPPNQSVFDFRQAVDEVLLMLKPLADRHEVAVLPFYQPECPTLIEQDEYRLKLLLFYEVERRIRQTHEPSEIIEFDLDRPSEQILMHGQADLAGTDLGEINGAHHADGILIPRLPETPDAPPRFSARALIIDDEFEWTTSLSLRLLHLGLTTECERHWNDQPCDLIFTRSGSITTAKPIVVVDGYARAEGHALFSPLQQDELVQTLQSILGAVPAQKRVLAIDDNAINLKLLAIQLEQLGCYVTRVSSGLAGVNLAITEQFDAVLTDLQMDQVDGFETCRRIRANGQQMPVIAVTAHLGRGERARLDTIGFTGCLIKPVSTTDLAQALGLVPPEVQGSRVAGEPALPDGLFNADLSVRLANHRPELASELLKVLISNLPGDHADIERAFSGGDKVTLKQAVHRLSGAVRYSGVPRLTSALEQVQLALDGDGLSLGSSMARLKAEVTELTRWYENNGSPFDDD